MKSTVVAHVTCVILFRTKNKIQHLLVALNCKVRNELCFHRVNQVKTVSSAKILQLVQCVGVKKKKTGIPILYVFCMSIYLSVNRWKGMVLTVQVDVVTFTPVAPQRRLIQAGAADLDGVVQSGHQIQSQSGLTRYRHHLETEESARTHNLTWG